MAIERVDKRKKKLTEMWLFFAVNWCKLFLWPFRVVEKKRLSVVDIYISNFFLFFLFEGWGHFFIQFSNSLKINRKYFRFVSLTFFQTVFCKAIYSVKGIMFFVYFLLLYTLLICMSKDINTYYPVLELCAKYVDIYLLNRRGCL